MFFNPNDFRRRQERTGPSGLLEIFSREWLTIVKVDALTCLSLVPLVTLPPRAFGYEPHVPENGGGPQRHRPGVLAVLPH